MSKVLIALGIIVALAGIAAGGMIYTTPGQMQVMAITPEVAAVLLVGGLTIIGLGVVAIAVENSVTMLRDLRIFAAHADHAAHAEPTIDTSARVEDVAVLSVASTDAAAEAGLEPALEPAHPPSAVDALIAESRAAAEKAIAASKLQAAETVVALDKAKTDLNKVLSVPEPVLPPPQPPQPEPAALEAAEADIAVEEAEDNQLYVVEERLIRGRPARVLSDGTVEAETDEGWMRFENLEHLEEYLDAMSPGAA